MKFADFVCFEAIVPELNAADRDGVIAELVSSLDKAGRLGKNNCREITEAMIKREREASTGMGRSIAVPHIKHKAVKDIVATVGKSRLGIDFSALDKKAVHSVIIMVSPVDNPDKHLKAMENIFKHLQNERFRKFLMQSQTVEEIQDLIREADEDPLL